MVGLLRFYGKDIQDITFQDWIVQKPAILKPLVIKWLDELKILSPDVEIIFHDHHPVACVETAPFAYINAYKSHVNLGFFYGAELPDPNGMLEGTGKRMRHIKLHPDKNEDKEAIEQLISISYADILERLMAQ